jgi:hypothetical protein
MSPVLVDDVGGWLTAAMDRTGAWTGGSVSAEIDDLVDALAGFGEELVLVSPEVGMTVVPETAAGRRFADELGTLNQRLAALCDRVVLVVANLTNAPVRGVTLSSAPRALPAGSWRVRSLLDSSRTAPLRIGGNGELRSYVPIAELAPLEGYILELQR